MPYKVGVSFNQEGDLKKKILTISFEVLTTYSPLDWNTHNFW